MYALQTSAPAETEAFGVRLAGCLRAGDVVLVEGELGAGKTTLVRGAARALGVADPVTSPTFAIGHRYRGAEVTVAHLDLYRLAGLHGEEPGLLEDYLGSGRIAFVEWPRAGEAELAQATMRVALLHAGQDRRRIEVREGAERLREGAGRLSHGRSPGASGGERVGAA
ncbi:MAG TPA: tRNA (adenosine(37)-N6)-threonylcarbamoyltransferase complex ATPase subunit type 1 TsaE [Solirubrobacteraceae bacterium]|nr:tRNA (adenosine(37)-N6)-threonylcarbamoyltransferase complex ATPase subunit type 1 TsaE [Solirubrobacteraceae bacterium]